MAQTNCRNFSGYKPCALNHDCSASCTFFSPTDQTVAIIHLGALGAVVRSTSLLAGIRQKHPTAKLIWITDKPAHHLLQNHPLIDKVLTSEFSDLLVAQSFQIQTAYVIDKNLKATGIAEFLRIPQVFGFVSKNGSILPATESAHELWSLGLSNQKKFFENQKSEVQLMQEAFELPNLKSTDYDLPLTALEQQQVHLRRSQWKGAGAEASPLIVGINTGCSDVIAAKKLSVAKHRELILAIQERYSQKLSIVLLGGPEDSERNQEIAKNLDVISSSTVSGLRDGLVSVAACDIVLTGDSLGMHMAISQRSYVIAWFGPTCAQEIEFFGRGEALHAEASCTPCWKRSCQKEVMCYDQVPVKHWLSALQRGMEFASKSSHSNSISWGSSSFDSPSQAYQEPVASS